MTKDEEIQAILFLAGNAPNEIPGWFTATLPMDVPALPDYRNEVATDEEKEIMRQWVLDGCFDLEGRLRDFQNRFESAVRLKEEHKINCERHRYFAWRWYFAHEMLRRKNHDV